MARASFATVSCYGFLGECLNIYYCGVKLIGEDIYKLE